MGFFLGEAIETAEKIKEMARTEIDMGELISRMEQSLERKALKDGFKLITNNPDEYAVYHLDFFDYGIGIGVQRLGPWASKSKSYCCAACFCKPSDYGQGSSWSDRKAIELIGRRFVTGDVVRKDFFVRVDFEVAYRAFVFHLLADSFNAESELPTFLKREQLGLLGTEFVMSGSNRIQ